ncbi:MAG: hypothetical protein AB7K04_01885 [Pseudorhodoplanes sp.]
MGSVREKSNDPRTQQAPRRAAAEGHGPSAGIPADLATWVNPKDYAGWSRAPRMISRFEGPPETFFAHDGAGDPVAIVRPRVLTPARAKIADSLAPLTSLGVCALSFWVLCRFPHVQGMAWVGAALAPWFFAPLFKRLWRGRLRRTITLLFTESHFAVQIGRGAPVVHDRENPHRFRLEARHEAALKEAERHEIAIERARIGGKVIRPPKYQQETRHLLIEHETYGRFVTEIMGRLDGERVLGRRLRDVIRLIRSGKLRGDRETWDAVMSW